MGRLWLALVLMIALVAPALAFAPHVPAPPTITSASLEIGQQRTSAGLYDVHVLRLAGTFDRYTSTVRIRLHTPNGDQVVETTPDQLTLYGPKLLTPLGTVTLDITSANGTLESEPTHVSVVAERYHPMNCFPLSILLLLVGAVTGVLVMLVVLFKMRTTEAERARVRSATEPTPLPRDAAEQHIRTVAFRALFALVVVAAIVVGALGVDMLIVPIYGSPMLLLVAITATTRVVNAGRAIALLHRPGAAAQTRLDQLEVSVAGRTVALRSSPKLVERARRNALPKATL